MFRVSLSSLYALLHLFHPPPDSSSPSSPPSSSSPSPSPLVDAPSVSSPSPPQDSLLFPPSSSSLSSPLMPVLHSRQSPINIDTKSLHSRKTNPLSIRFIKGDCIEVNTGEDGAWHVTTRAHTTSALIGTHLPGSYRLAQFHAHWGGSEHTIDGRKFDAEFHFVYWNTRYHTPEEATKHGDGYAVLAVFVEKGKENGEFNKLLDLIEESRSRKRHVRMPLNFDPAELIPRNASSHYYTYLGGLTTPPYSECVIWTLLCTPITLSETQLGRLSKLTKQNCRACQKLHGRSVMDCKSVV